jgi:hypothetical protein
MPQTPMPLPEADCQVMNTPRNEFFETTQHLPQRTQRYVINATHRLAEADWITCRLEEQIATGSAPIVQEGLLSLQLYLLLTCADTLGHVCSPEGPSKRFSAFFNKLPQEAKLNLTDNIFTWKTDFAEWVRLRPGDAITNPPSYPSRQEIQQAIQPLTPDKRLEAVVDFLYFRRNYYTHESKYPQLGDHPNLSVMQRQRLNVPNTATLGELDRLQPLSSGTDIYFTYYETNDVIATVRWSIVRGLGRVIGRV